MKKTILKILNMCGYNVTRYALPKNPERGAVMIAKKHFRNKKIIACEIGTCKGEHALQMLRHLNIKKLYIIDPFKKYIQSNKINNSNSFPSYNHAISVKKKSHQLLNEYKDKIVWIEKYSDNSVKDIKEKLDFLYIDANHYSPYINNDIKNYYPLVKYGGIISGHDYNSSWRDVIYAVNEFARKIKKKVFIGDGSDWVIFK